AQLLGLGFTRHAVAHRLATGRLHQVRRGIYAVGRRDFSPKRRWMAALLACGDDAFLSHRSAAALYEIGVEQELHEVSVRRPADLRRPGIRTHRRPSLPSQDVGTLNRVPVTSPVRTLLDYATLEPPNRVERAVNEADKRDVTDPDALHKA